MVHSVLTSWSLVQLVSKTYWATNWYQPSLSAQHSQNMPISFISRWTAGETVRSLENVCHTWAPYRCVHDEALHKVTFTFTFTLPSFKSCLMVLIQFFLDLPLLHFIVHHFFWQSTTIHLWDVPEPAQSSYLDNKYQFCLLPTLPHFGICMPSNHHWNLWRAASNFYFVWHTYSVYL